jgi:hypothetical protein
VSFVLPAFELLDPDRVGMDGDQGVDDVEGDVDASRSRRWRLPAPSTQEEIPRWYELNSTGLERASVATHLAFHPPCRLFSLSRSAPGSGSHDRDTAKEWPALVLGLLHRE